MSVLARVQEQHVSLIDEQGITSHAELRMRMKRELIGRLGLSAVAHMVAAPDLERSRSEMQVVCESIFNTSMHALVPEAEQAALIAEVLDEVCGLGPLQPLLDDASVTEIMVNGCASLFFERGGTMYKAPAVFETGEQIRTVVDRILAPLGRRLDESSPIVNARLANGDRLNAVIAPIALEGPVVTIRKFSNRISSLATLVSKGALPQWYATLLSWAVQARQDIAVAGGTGSGKTTLLNALSCEIPHGERIITIEDSAELRFETHPHVVALESRAASIEGSGAVSIRDLVTNALRMRPDRIVVGEVRGEECIDMLQAMNTGHDGSLTTLHAGSPNEAILRLVLMARFGMDLPVDIIEEQVATALDLLVMSNRLPDGSRLIGESSFVRRGKTGGVELVECVSFDPVARTWQLIEEPHFITERLEAGTLGVEEVSLWRQSCSR